MLQKWYCYKNNLGSLQIIVYNVTAWCYCCEMSEPCIIKELLDKPFLQLKYEDKLVMVKTGRPTLNIVTVG